MDQEGNQPQYSFPDNSLISAIDNHNVANGDESWFETKLTNTTGFLSDVSEGITQGAPAAIVVGINSVLNSAISVANFVGADIEQINTYEMLKDMDDDLGQYYKQHKEGIELAGFVATSFVPGMAGVKAMQAAKAGFLGTNMAKSAGLMQSLTRNYATAAKVEFATGASPFSVLNTNVVKSLAQGLGSAALEMAAFETAVSATMFKSPVLEDQGANNLFWNIATGTLIGGGIGGVLHGVGTIYGIKKAGAVIDRELFPFRYLQELDESASTDLKLINYFQQKLNLPEAKLAEDYGPIRPGEVSDLDPATRLKLITDERKKTSDRLDVLIRQEFNKYAGNDEVIGQQLFEKFKDQKSLQDVTAALINSKGATRITENERLVVGDVLFPEHGIKREAFQSILGTGDYSKLLSETATKGTTGYRIIGDLNKIKVAGAGEKAGELGFLENRDAAFAAGIDLYRNSNGTFSVNPASSILKESTARRTPNNLIVDFEQGGAIVDKATPGLADLATKARPIEVRGNTVLAGNLNPIKVGQTFDPLEDDYLAIQARYIWASKQQFKWSDRIVHERDLPMLEKAYYDGDVATQGWRLRKEDGSLTNGPKGENLRRFIEAKKTEFAQKLDGKPIDELELRLNVSRKWLEGGQDELAKLRPGVDYSTPRYARIDYPDSIHAMETYNAANIDGAVSYENSVMQVVQRHKQNFANYSGNLSDSFPDAPNWSDPTRTPTRAGAGASLFGFTNSNYGTAGGWAQFVGSLTNRLKVEKKTATITELNRVAAAVNTPDLRAELDLVTNKLRSSPEAWIFSPKDNLELIQRKEFRAVAAGEDASDSIPVSETISDFLRAHSAINAERQVHIKNMKATAGVMDDADLDVVYPPPIDTSKYKYFVFVEPKGITLGDRKRVIVAKDEATLLKLINQVDQNDFRIITKTESEEWHKAIGDYDFQLGLNESLVDSSLKRKGILSDHFAGNPSQRILDDYLNWHSRQEEILATRMVEHRYSQSFQELQHLGDRYTNIATSQFRSLTEALVERVKDPYQDIVKTALDISRASEYQWWRSFNETVRSAIEGPARELGKLFAQTPKVDDAFVENINKKSAELGMGTPFRDAYSALVASGNIADKPFLAKYIGKAQALMSSTLLQLDFFNAINNIISTPVLMGAEMQHLISAIQKGDSTVAGKLANLLSVTTPEGAASLKLPTVGRLAMNAVQNYRRDHLEKLGLLERFQRIGAVTDVLTQERQMLNTLTVDFGKLSPGQAESLISKATDYGRKLTGNRLAEEMTRFVPADMMRQITDLALEAGILKDVKEADEYIQLFVNRVQGNYLHSQRPIVFQGVVGQAISLFQTYQFNLMQQMFKYVGEGDKKSVGLLLGLQSSIYGMQGLPAFNFLNTHIVGNASGNVSHSDLFQGVNTVFGKQLADWMLYGAGSNALGVIDSRMKVNIYSRGDINPRQLSVLPTTISDIPVVNASVHFVRNLWQLAEKTGNGAAVWPTLSQAIEHNGLSRPLAGLAQVVQGYTTTNQGSLLTESQDFYNIATVSRLAGGKPFDESVALDALYRVNAYRAANLSRIQDVGSALKASLIAGRNPTDQEITDFATNYAKAGGRIETFNRFLTGQMMSANRSQVNKLVENLNNPFARQMQIIMGGQPLPDFLNQPKEATQ
jgi:hypothetical protein